MITITLPAWMIWFISGWIALAIVSEGLKIYEWYLKRKLDKLKAAGRESE